MSACVDGDSIPWLAGFIRAAGLAYARDDYARAVQLLRPLQKMETLMHRAI